jgi:D-3-phosphoglycerate dehydrogenase / 2-oxoglutarate reductase
MTRAARKGPNDMEKINILCTVEEFINNDFPKQFNMFINPYKRVLTEKETEGFVERHQPVGIIAGVEPLTRNVLSRSKPLKVISRHGIGLNSVDLEAAAEMGIIVRNTPDAPTKAVAELALGSMLCLLRGIRKADVSIREGGWVRPMGALLYGKSVGIIGCGRIGTYLAHLLTGLGCRVTGYDPYLSKHDTIHLVSIEELLSGSDIVSLHIPYTRENHGLIGEKQLKMMKKNSMLINTARGGIVDEDALYLALADGEIAGAALDCFAAEPYAGKLKDLDNIILTSHIGSFAVEAKLDMERQSLANLVSSLKELGIMKG